MTDAADWHEFPWQSEESAEPLCVAGAHPTDLDCRVEGADFRPGQTEPIGEVVVWAYNVERGLRLEGQLEAAMDGAGMPRPDILLLNEADRGCSRTRTRNVAREYARALGMCYVYGVEFVELPRFWGPGGGAIRRKCEHGNAIVSRFPLGNVRLIRHARSRSWHSSWQRLLGIGQPRLGGRVALAADVRVGDRTLRVYSIHFESGRGGRGVHKRDEIRTAQAIELVQDAAGLHSAVVIGGDMNVSGYLRALTQRDQDEPTMAALATAGFEDAHARIPPADRVTSDSGVVIDAVVGRNLRFAGSGIGPAESWKGLSDHLPIWARVAL
jgi:endonuclease/exonuclease/phosphatase family metal-dependent hydrolase